MASERDGEGVVGRWARARVPRVMVVGECGCSDDCAQALALGLEMDALECQLCHTPERADILLVAGRISQKMSLVVEGVYRRMQPTGKVVVWGMCACSGGWSANDAGAAIEQLVDIAAFVPGCPPRPHDLATALKRVL